MQARRKYLLPLVLGICIGFICIIILYLINLNIVIETLDTVEGASIVLTAYIIRISILAGISTYLFIRWFRQEKMYTSDLPFLFGMFFLFLVFGKLLEMLSNFMYPIVAQDVFLFYLKIRQLVIIATLAPMIFLSIMMMIIFLQANGKIKKYNDPRERNAFSLKILTIIAVVEAILIIVTPNTTISGINLAIFIILSLLVTTWMFYFSYRNKRLSQIQPLIVAIGFTGYLISNILRVLFQNTIGENALFVAITEILDILICLVIFIGYIKKIKY
ncbi:MAG: hypothetical protein KAT57_02495 [Candidatus Lokiarchaeota archaeon]|nr:hypothetical protein [Candidatus Lokiarchaeota archaeon]